MTTAELTPYYTTLYQYHITIKAICSTLDLTRNCRGVKRQLFHIYDTTRKMLDWFEHDVVSYYYTRLIPSTIVFHENYTINLTSTDFTALKKMFDDIISQTETVYIAVGKFYVDIAAECPHISSTQCEYAKFLGNMIVYFEKLQEDFDMHSWDSKYIGILSKIEHDKFEHELDKQH